MAAVRVAEVRARLERHGLDSHADEAGLTAAIEARGWVVEVKQKLLSKGKVHYRARASRPAPDTHPSLGIRIFLSHAGSTPQIALILTLGKILAREEQSNPAATRSQRRRRP